MLVAVIFLHDSICMALCSLYCAEVPLRNCSLTHSLAVTDRDASHIVSSFTQGMKSSNSSSSSTGNSVEESVSSSVKQPCHPQLSHSHSQYRGNPYTPQHTPNRAYDMSTACYCMADELKHGTYTSQHSRCCPEQQVNQ